MPRKTGAEGPYDYDRESNTVRVGQHDLARLLLMFRSLVRDQEPGSWEHMRDYDLSFERLADAMDAAAQTQQGGRWQGPAQSGRAAEHAEFRARRGGAGAATRDRGRAMPRRRR